MYEPRLLPRENIEDYDIMRTYRFEVGRDDHGSSIVERYNLLSVEADAETAVEAILSLDDPYTLFEYSDDDGNNILHVIALNHHPDVVVAMLQCFTPTDWSTLFDQHNRYGQYPMVIAVSHSPELFDVFEEIACIRRFYPEGLFKDLVDSNTIIAQYFEHRARSCEACTFQQFVDDSDSD